MKRIKIVNKSSLLFICLITLIYSCSNESCENSVRIEYPNFDYLIDSLILNDKNLVGCSNIFPNGTSDSIISGYTNMERGVYQNCQSEFKTLSIVGLKFENLTSQYTDDYEYYYHYSFTDPNEKERFEAFLQFSENYIKHGKNVTYYFEIKNDWFQYYKPMP